MSSALKTREEAIMPFTPAADYTGKEGYLVTLSGDTATISTSATVPATGVILDGGDTDETVSVGILGALSGTVRMKTSGAITKGALVEQAADGTIVTDVGAGTGRVVVGVALETAASGDLIEVAPLTPMILP